MSEAMQETFVIDSEAKAEWAMRKIKEARNDRDRFVSWYKQKIKEIEEQTEKDTAYLESMLLDYFGTVPHKITKTQESYSCPGGKMILKKQAPEFTRNDAAVIEWLKANQGERYIKVSESLDWAGLKADTAVVGGNVVNADGEIIPGIEVVERGTKFVVEV